MPSTTPASTASPPAATVPLFATVGQAYDFKVFDPAVDRVLGQTNAPAGTYPPGLNLDPNTGELYGTPTQAGSFSFTDTTTSAGGDSATVLYAITVQPSGSPPGQGNAGPQSTAPTTLPDATSGQEYQSPGVGSGGSIFSAAGLPAGLRMDPFTGAVLGTPAEQGPFNFTVRITSPDNITSTLVRSSLTVNPPPSLSHPGGLPDAKADSPYTGPITTDGGTGPLTYSVTGGSLPPGLTLGTNAQDPQRTGEISGTPTQAGTFNFSITVKDKWGATDTQSYSVKVNDVTQDQPAPPQEQPAPPPQDQPAPPPQDQPAPPQNQPAPPPAFSPIQFVSVAYGPYGEIFEAVTEDGRLTQFDKAGAHPLMFGVATASVAYGPYGEVLLVVGTDGVLTQYDAVGAHPLMGGVRSATVVYGPYGEVVEVVTQDGVLTQYDGAGPHNMTNSLKLGNVVSASVAYGPYGEVLVVVGQDGNLIQFDRAGLHALLNVVRSASVAYGPTGEVMEVLTQDGKVTRYDSTGFHLVFLPGVNQ